MQMRHTDIGMEDKLYENHIELLTYEMEVTNILQTRTNELNEEGTVSIIKTS